MLYALVGYNILDISLYNQCLCLLLEKTISNLKHFFIILGNRFNDPEDYHNYLDTHLRSEYIQINKLLSCTESLRVALANNPLSWVEMFGSQGMKLILRVLDVGLKK